MATMSQAAQEPGLVRAIRRWDLVAIGLNLMVGAGIFGLPSVAFRLAGVLSPVAFAVAGAVASLIALCLAEVGSRFSETGGSYLYARVAFGSLVGFQTGWLRWLSGTAAFAANANLLVDYLGEFSPVTATAPWHALLVAAVVVVLAGINILGVRNGAQASNVFALSKLIVLGVFVVAGAVSIAPGRQFAGVLPGYGDFSTSVLVLFYAFVGFETIAIPSAEARDPRRDLPFALAIDIVLVVALYVVIQIICMSSVPALESSTRPLADAAAGFLGGHGAALAAAGAIITIGGNLNAQLLGTPRNLFAMAEQRQLPPVLAAVHRRFRTPHVAILLSAITILVLALSGGFTYLATLTVITRILSYATVCAALPVLRRKDVSPPVFTLPFGAMIPMLALLACGWLLSSTRAAELRDTGIAVGIGVILWALARRRTP